MTHDWIILNPRHDGGRLDCLRCGRTYSPRYPIPITMLVALAEAFDREHADCQLRSEGLACECCGEFGHAWQDCVTLKPSDPDAWLRGPDTGRSSKTIWNVMMGRPGSDHSIPHDPDDFGRCYRLLKLFPAWRARIGELKSMVEWVRLVNHWDELEALYEEELVSGKGPKLYARLKELTR